MIALTTPLTDEMVRSLRAGDTVALSGVIYTARDAAHGRMAKLLEAGEALPVDFVGQVIYYAGPCPAPPDAPIGACGPTTSARMNAYAPGMFEKTGLKAVIGKGLMSTGVQEALIRNGGVYLCATGGAGQLIANCIQSAAKVAFEDLGTEAIHRLEVKDFPLVVAMDAKGNNLFESGPAQYRKHK